MGAPDATPLSAPPRLSATVGGPLREVTSTTVVDPSDRIFAGHYPNFPIFPGVCLVESAHQSFLAAARGDGQHATLLGIDSVRFRGPVFPGDEVTTWIQIKANADLSWRCAARLATARGDAATVRLRYTLEAAT